jgi:hypothetical protein
MHGVSGTVGTSRARRVVPAVALVVVAAVVGGACAEEADPPDTAGLAVRELAGWERQDTYAQAEAHAYDQVAAAPTGDGAVWLTRAGEAEGDDGTLAVWTLAGGRTSQDFATSPGGIVIPVGVAADAEGWTAVAVARDRPDGTNTGVVAWRLPGVASQAARPESLALPRGVPASITVARSGGTSVVAGLVDGLLTTWVSDGGRWSAGFPDLGVDRVVSARVATAPDGFLLAVVGDDGRPSLWSSPDGLAWSGLTLPDTGAVAAVATLSPTDGGVVAAWLAGMPAGDEAPVDATEVVVHLAEGTTVTAFGTISAQPGDGVERIDINGAARQGQWLLVAGAAIAEDGSARPGLWAGSGRDWARSTQADLVGQRDLEFRTVSVSDDGLYGLLTQRGGVDVHIWRTATAS